MCENSMSRVSWVYLEDVRINIRKSLNVIHSIHKLKGEKDAIISMVTEKCIAKTQREFMI